jgi:hypothetical protein
MKSDGKRETDSNIEISNVEKEEEINKNTEREIDVKTTLNKEETI